ncbi:uncharacterized protein LOC131264478 [Anopheles coustani]|uniref:uncharacterized protein LOC131264478 n=1 Tax=Anopheles coustani TaxID=139045 RepID=UPI00265B63BA|nr:uncharacterized protein LOC131264478 [Anopheles coustani]
MRNYSYPEHCYLRLDGWTLNRKSKEKNSISGSQQATGETTSEAAKSESEDPTQSVSPILALLKRAIKTKANRRIDECLFMMTYCVRKFHTPETISSSRGFFYFLEYYT